MPASFLKAKRNVDIPSEALDPHDSIRIWVFENLEQARNLVFL
jgi:hypothetical protein